jgi:hypothetical protein
MRSVGASVTRQTLAYGFNHRHCRLLRAPSGHAAAPPMSVMNARRFIDLLQRPP